MEETQTLHLDDGSVYTGPVKNGLPHGKGVLIAPNGVRYEGDLYFGQLHGQGIHIWPDGARFEGNFVDDRGKGVLIMPDGRRDIGRHEDVYYISDPTALDDMQA